jgi:dTMP kinase
MPPQYSTQLLQERPSKYGEKINDIHERNLDYLIVSYNDLKIAEKYQWLKIDCFTNNNIRSIGEIYQEIYIVVEKIID